MKRIVIFVLIPLLFACSQEKSTTVKPQSSSDAPLVKAEAVKASAAKVAKVDPIVKEVVVAAATPAEGSHMSSMTDQVIVAAINPRVHGHSPQAAVQVAANDADGLIHGHD